MKTWYADKDLKILFDHDPDTDNREITPETSDEEVDDIKSKPLIIKNRLFCRLTYKGKSYGFLIKKGYTWDGATIPPFAWALIGSKLDPQFHIASLVHDTLCQHHEYVGNNRYLSTLVFCALLEVARVGPYKRFCMFHSVDNFQKVIGGWKCP